jgi:hypothetical protein
MNIINLTPHSIVLDVDGVQTTFPTSGIVARVSQVTVGTGMFIAGAEISTSTFGAVEMPATIDGTMFIVSAMVLTALGNSRLDVIAPKTDATAIRNEAGHIVAVKGWLQ